MNIHYFQRYHSKENVSTGNAMLLLSRLYHYSPYKLNSFMQKLVANEINEFDTGISFNSQIKNTDSVPDGQIKQNSFNIVIETKLGKSFDISQIANHLKSFNHEDFQIMLTLGPYEIQKSQEFEVHKAIDLENKSNGKNIYHIHLTFEKMISMVEEEIDSSRDYELADIVEDFKGYCAHEGLFSNRYNVMRAVPVGATLEENLKFDLYYDPAERGYSEHSYLALYKDKTIQAVGKILVIVEADIVNDDVVIKNNVKIRQSKKMISLMQLKQQQGMAGQYIIIISSFV